MSTKLTDNLTNAQVKENILSLLKSVQRSGMEDVIQWLEESDFFTAPASSRYHLACEGGLARHSLNVYSRLRYLVRTQTEVYVTPRFCDPAAAESLEEAVIIVSLLHDICKCNFYKLGTRNVKNEQTGKWEQVPWYTIENEFPMGHGEKSVYILGKFIRLTDEEAMAIRWHMGGFDDSVKGGSRDMNTAFAMYPLAALLHAADMLATNIDEVEEKEDN